MPKTRMNLAAMLLAGAAMALALPAYADSVLKIARDQDNTTFDPIKTIQNSDIWVMDNMNANLVRVTKDGVGLEPDLAEKWTLAPDNVTYTFTLRDGLKFSDGSPIKASDVKFSLERLRDTKDSVMGSMYKIITKIDVPDDKTVVITTDKPSAPLLSTLAMFAASIVPESVVKAEGDDFGTKPIGAGAFVLKDWAHGDKVELVKNPNYWEASRVKLDGVQWLYVPDDTTRMLKLKAGEVDAAIFVPFNMVGDLQKDPNIDVHLDPSSREDFMIMNEAKKPLDNVKVRQAICQAIDREAIVKAVLFGNGKVANSFIPGGALYYNPDNPTCKYDPDAAKKLLADAGASNLSFKLLIDAGNSVNDQNAVLIKNDLAKVGINIDIVKEEAGQEWDSTVAGDYDLSIEYWTNDIIDPDEKATFALYGKDDNKSFYTNYNNPHVTELIDQGREEMDKDKRTAIYNEIQKIASDDAFWVDLYYSPFRNASRKNVKGFYQNPTGRFMLEDTEISQ
ncbi:MAG TPA: ABC transporter substrate-binding protein [Dongiaceae bacterium]|nr:ABC transporter substrate-binding protein [Dongiaceae bacterium]